MAGTLDTFLRGAIFVAILALGNLVAGGVLVLLGPQVLAMQESPLKVLAVIALGALAIMLAVLFIKGCIREVADQLQYPHRRRGG